jgi:hypothetical protein
VAINDDQNTVVGRVLELVRNTKTPIGLFVLVVLADYGILATLAAKVEADTLTPFLWAAASLLGLSTAAFVIVILVRPEVMIPGLGTTSEPAQNLDSTSQDEQYDVFISSPMSTFKDNQSYVNHRCEVMQVMSALRVCGFRSVYCAIDRCESIDHFEAKDIAFAKDTRALRNSARFLMIYPGLLSSRVPSSVLVEAGMALALNKPSIYWVAKSAKLPFMLEMANQAQNSRVSVYRYTNVNDILHYFDINKGGAFDKHE